MIEYTKATNLGRKSPGRPKLYNGEPTKTVPVVIPTSWNEEKEITGRNWRFIVRKGLDVIKNKEDELVNELKKLSDKVETQGNIIRRLHLEKNEMKDEIERIKNNN